MSRWSMYDNDDWKEDPYASQDAIDRDERDAEVEFYSNIPRNHLNCAPVGFYCAEHNEMLITPDRCLSGIFETYVDDD